MPPDEQHGGCGFTAWHDDPLPKFLSDLIGDLRDAVVMALEQELRNKNAEVDAMKRKYVSVVFGFCVFVLGLVVGKMVLT